MKLINLIVLLLFLTENLFSQITIIGTVTPATYYGAYNGAIDISVTGGTPPYTYLWTNSATTQDINHLFYGNYSVTVCDANSVCESQSFYVGVVPFNTDSSVVHYESLTGTCDGSINLVIFGGLPPYTYQWSTGETTQNIDSLCIGQYIVTVCDDSNICIIDTFNILTTPFNLDSSFVINVTYPGYCNGNIDIVISGNNNPPYTYQWSTGSTYPYENNLCAGEYYITVCDDSSNCVSDTFIITEPLPLGFDTVELINANHGIRNGRIEVIGTGGIPPYFYYMEDEHGNPFSGNSDGIFDELYGGTYFFGIMDSYATTMYGAPFPISIISEINPQVIPSDTISDTLINSNCPFIQYLPLDSAYIINSSVIDTNTVLLTWQVWQEGNSFIIDSVPFQFSDTSYNFVYFSIDCDPNEFYLYGLVNILSTDIENITNSGKQIKIYPNPAYDNLNISITDNQFQTVSDNWRITDIAISDITGRQVKNIKFKIQSKQYKVNIENLPAGIYFVNAITKNGSYVKKLIVR